MGLFEWLTRTPNFTHFADHYALNRESLFAALKVPIQECLKRSELVLLLAHFPECFSEMVTQLDTWQSDYEVVAAPVDEEWFAANSHTGKVYLSLAEMVKPFQTNVQKQTIRSKSSLLKTDGPQTVSIFVLERHPLLAKDQILTKTAKRLTSPVRLGYFLSLEDDVLKQLIHEKLLLLLKQMGLTDQELITSSMLTGRLKKVLSRQRVVENEQPADSAADWYLLNSPEEAN